MTHDNTTALLDDMRALTEGLSGSRRYFHETYTRTTQAIVDEIGRGGFADNDWVARWDLEFADFYLGALRAPEPSGPWRAAFGVAGADPLRQVLFGMNAHINYDLPQAILRVITPQEFDDPGQMALRLADHRHLDTILRSRIGAEEAELTAVSQVSRLDRMLRPLNQVATARLLTESRAKVWRNAHALDRARRAGRLPERLAELEVLCTRRVQDLSAPGQVLLRLARRGFGVLLPGA